MEYRGINLKSEKYDINVSLSFQTTKGKLQMTFDKFNVEYASNCKKKDYLFVGSLAKYTSVSEYF